MRSARYYWAKARLTRIWAGAAIAALFLSAGTSACWYARENITPRSVSVSGYTRQDGSKVRSYYRRPPGSRKHDSPYEALGVLGFLLHVGGIAVFAPRALRFVRADPRTLLPPPPGFAERPPHPKLFRVPTRSARARKVWSCTTCGALIPTGATYYYVPTLGPQRDRHCAECPARVRNAKKDAAARWFSYLRAQEEQLRQVFGESPGGRSGDN